MSDLKTNIEANQLARTMEDIDISSFLLKNPKKLNADLLKACAEQLNFLQKSKTKLPTWYSNQRLIGPSKLSIEQTSSEITASFKASKFKGENFLDLSGGFGVDTYYFSKKFTLAHYVEIQKELSEIVHYNFQKLEANNITIYNENALDFIKKASVNYDLIYLDPARRDANNNKLIDISQCEPNLIEILPDLLIISKTVLVKYSPMLDIKKTINQIQNIKSVQVVSIKNEVKELLFEIGQNPVKSPKIFCTNIKDNNKKETLEFEYENEQMMNCDLGTISEFLYEPNAAILKGGGFKTVAAYFGLTKIGVNSHLYTSKELIEEFYGRTFKIEKVGLFDKKEIIKNIPNKTANISVRNFPINADEIKKKLNFKDGGDTYLFFTQDILNKKVVLYCKKM